MDVISRQLQRFESLSVSDLHHIKNTAIDDFQNLRFTPLTVTISLTVISTILFFASGNLGSSSSAGGKKSKKKKKKKVTPTEKSNREIAAVLAHFEESLMPDVEDYLENHMQLKDEDMQYKYNYYEEMMLKELMKLDGINVLNNDILRDNRKKVIRHIQSFQKRLDAVKKEQQF
ncbi:hypothetical protein BABINDRAFT_171339 [Babjeviella inositovora NRRL Y-12698]|uniref:BAG domain-containing protein n=1 Tax=Babjeviella inositovora NRRL Y-12698 TaxID=984486 RepID=A0A1E3QPU1_9ASCO|nr:uncharacterized protein BABINDRAFT_171339 [Babjeviella inositovora NRRL Y-12698]ODQ79681.1 hypothetical protein BABINDRAFT_171339 [Babjeviella inositovora NRRL Y-12698]